MRCRDQSGLRIDEGPDHAAVAASERRIGLLWLVLSQSLLLQPVPVPAPGNCH
jgi:hypothetical protein